MRYVATKVVRGLSRGFRGTFCNSELCGAEILRNFDYNSAAFIDIRILKLLLRLLVPFWNIGFCCLMLLHRSDADHREEGKATSLIMFLLFRSLPAIS